MKAKIHIKYVNGEWSDLTRQEEILILMKEPLYDERFVELPLKYIKEMTLTLIRET